MVAEASDNKVGPLTQQATGGDTAQPASVVPVPATLLASAVANAPQSKPSLADIDKALAANLDVMLQRDVTTVDAVPVDDLDNQATLAQNSAAVAGLQNPKSQRSSTAVDHAPSARESNVVAGQGSATDSRAQEIPQPPSAASDHAATVSATGAGADDGPARSTAVSAPPTTTAPVAEASATPSTAVAPPVVVPIESQVPTTPAAPAPIASATSPAPSPAPSANEQATVAAHSSSATAAAAKVQGDEHGEPRRSFAAFVVQPLLGALAFINAPMRKVPASLQPAVNWVALSLALWVPVVWMMAMMQSRAVDAKAAVNESPAAAQSPSHPPIHEHSTVKQ